MDAPVVFISHSSGDQAVAALVCQALEQEHLRCWIAPRDIGVGEIWDEAIVNGINSSQIMVLVFSSATNESRHVKREIHLAFDKNKIVIPFRIEDVKPDGRLEYMMVGVQWLDAVVPPLEPHLKVLVERVQAIMEAGGAPSGVAEPAPLRQQAVKTALSRGTPQPAVPRKRPALLWLAVALCLVVIAGLAAVKMGWFNGAKPPSAGNIQKTAPTSPSPAASGAPSGQNLQIPEAIAEGLLIHQVKPDYPPMAQQRRIQGKVVLRATISNTGTVQNVELVSGDPLLAPAAIDAVRQWRYKPYVVNGAPVEAETQVTLDFHLTADTHAGLVPAPRQAPAAETSKSLTDDERRARDLVKVGQQRLAGGNYLSAINRFHLAVQLDPSNRDAQAGLAKALKAKDVASKSGQEQ